MKRLLSVLLTAGVLVAPTLAMAQHNPAAAPAAEGQIVGDAPGAAPDSAKGAEASTSGSGGEAHATPHYPLEKPSELDWTFAGPFGHWDLGQLQRGLKVYKEVCSTCHSMNLVSFRDFGALGYSDAQVRALAAEYQITDPSPNASGEMFQRPGIPSDRLPSPYPNPEAAAAALGGAHPPDLSLLAKARSIERGFPTFVFDIFTQYAEGGPDYIHNLLTSYGEPVPEHFVVQPGTYYNPAFVSSFALAMPAPLSDGAVTYDDGAPQTVEQYSRDVSAFLMWAAEPHLVERKATGFVVMIFLIGFAIMLYLVKNRVWADTPH
ncbi:cytochrome c1 [Aureimonas pseudogalii]|uniref:Cytochrome c1 n=1 Tax=Aureimonas pseudogalii TaxID=1744844 RepID=A0A7W6EAU0_9HYPH|nr:cytochrome c1 [Aureimonas pseudogalii]MBB3997913.1 ubiquinol-cytochrome c reductase cytochrome c1 subunit [Aureimonas pseudogalii]